MSDIVERLQRVQVGMANEEEDAVLAAIATIEALRGEVKAILQREHEQCIALGLEIKELRADAEKAEAEVARLKAALEVPEVWTVEERDGMAAACREAGKKHGTYETIFAAAAWLLRHRSRKALAGETT